MSIPFSQSSNLAAQPQLWGHMPPADSLSGDQIPLTDHKAGMGYQEDHTGGNLGQLMQNNNKIPYVNSQTPPRGYLNQAEEDVDDQVDPINMQFNGLEVKSIKSNTHSQHIYPS